MVGHLGGTKTADDIVAAVRSALHSAGAKMSRIDDIAQGMIRGEKQFRRFLRAIRKGRRSATFYVNAARLGRLDVGVSLSIRVNGFECGTVRLSGSKSGRRFTPVKHAGEHFNGVWAVGEASLLWTDKRVRSYIEAAAGCVLSGPLADQEKRVEAVLIQLLRAGRLKHNRPVLYPWRHGVPYQFPVPITARDKIMPAAGQTAGHIDVLARHGLGPWSRLRVLEVKRPGADDVPHALDQAMAYAAALEHMLERKAEYRKLLGFSRTPRLEATAVVEWSEFARRELSDARRRLEERSDAIPVKLSVLFYKWQPDGGRPEKQGYLALFDEEGTRLDREPAGRHATAER